MAVCLFGILLAWAGAAAMEPFAASQGVPQDGRLFRWAGAATPFLLGGAAVSGLLTFVKLPERKRDPGDRFEAPSKDDGWAFLGSWPVRIAFLVVAAVTIAFALTRL